MPPATTPHHAPLTSHCNRAVAERVLHVRGAFGLTLATDPITIRHQQFAIWPGTRETARSEIAPYPKITAKRGVYEVGRALRARRSEAGSAILRIAETGRIA